MSLIVEKLDKSFNNKKVVDEISFKMLKPSALGLVGLNGAGKTTTIRMIVDIIKKDSGKVLWNDETLDRNKVKIGYLPEERGIYQKVKVKKQLLYFARLKGMNEKEATSAVDYWSKKLEIEEYLNKYAKELSKGNQQKVQIACSLINNPDLIILDEPLSGLDPVNAELITNVLREQITKGKYVIVTSHQMNVIEEFCTELVMLKEGKIVLQGNIEKIKKEYIKNIICIDGDAKTKQTLKDNFENEYSIKLNATNELEISYDNENAKEKILEYIVKNKLDIKKYEIKKPTLREIFIEKAGEVNE